MPRRPKFDYDSDDFYDEILALSMQGFCDAEIADALEDKFGESLSPDVFGSMKNGNYANWTEEENERRSQRLNRVLARGRRKINAIVRGRYLKAALGGIKTKSRQTVSRHMIIDGKVTDDETIQTSEGEVELPPNIQALATWLYHHDPEWRRVQKGLDEETSEENVNGSVPIDRWINDNTEE